MCSSRVSTTKKLKQGRGPSTSFLGINSHYDAEEKNSEAVTAKLTEFVNKRFSAKLGDGKYHGKLDKYGCPSNCDKVTVATVNPEIDESLLIRLNREISA